MLDRVEKYLLKEEKIIWTGKSDVKKVFTANDIFLIPISIIFFIAALFVELASISRITSKRCIK